MLSKCVFVFRHYSLNLNFIFLQQSTHLSFELTAIVALKHLVISKRSSWQLFQLCLLPVLFLEVWRLCLEATLILLENMINPTKAQVRDLMKLFLSTQEEEQWEDLIGNQTENKKHRLEEGKLKKEG